MAARRTHYPDNSEILARKSEGRRENARATFAQKLAILERLKERVAPIVRAREARTASQRAPRAGAAKHSFGE
jgi:hypothetical protein